MATTVLNSKIGEIENKKPDVSGLVKKTDYKAIISDIETTYFTSSDYNKFTREILETKIQEKGLTEKSIISYLVKSSSLKKNLQHYQQKQN